jgi:hypothetical protein
MSETKGLYQVPDEPDAAPQGSVSAPVSAMGRADAPSAAYEAVKVVEEFDQKWSVVFGETPLAEY